MATLQGGLVLPRSYDRALELIVQHAELPRMPSHGLRHTAATHMAANDKDVGELRGLADILVRKLIGVISRRRQSPIRAGRVVAR